LFKALDAAASRRNGICQMVVGSLCVLLNIAIFVIAEVSHRWFHNEQMAGGGIWGGIFYITSGALIFVASSHRFWGHVIAALILNVISCLLSLPHLATMSISIMSWERERFYGWWNDQPVQHLQ